VALAAGNGRRARRRLPLEIGGGEQAKPCGPPWYLVGGRIRLLDAPRWNIRLRSNGPKFECG
jgi:hypothetical protein